MDIGALGISGFFFLRDPIGDGNFFGVRSNRASAVVAVAEIGARPLVELNVVGLAMTSVWADVSPALPRMISHDTAITNSAGINFTYDSWIWGEEADTSSDITTFLVEIEGSHDAFIPLGIVDGVSWCVSAYTSSDGGQNLYFDAPTGSLISDRIQKIRVWRVVSVPNESDTFEPFWTQLIGTHQS